jgi:ribose-phosphate pyrophosphokinase
VSALILPLEGNEPLAGRIAEQLEASVGGVRIRRFPDDETYMRIEDDCAGRQVVLVCSLARPDQKILPLVFLADAARAMGAARVGLVAPYLAYMRQDRQFQRGEAVTSRTLGALLSTYVDWLVTVDPHLHRYRSLDEIYRVPSRVVHAAPALAAWIASHVERPLLVGPDVESGQWVSDVAALAKAPFALLRKTRLGDRAVDVSAPDLTAHRDRTPVVVDDIVSSARTMIAAVGALVRAGLRAPVCVAVHALFAGDAESALRAAGAAQIVTTTTVAHATSRIDVAPLIVDAIRVFV